jgi:hypothetical protein
VLKRVDVEGVLPLLLSVSGYAAMERRSNIVEPCDLLKAIYIVDLEHVSMFWRDWEGFERLVLGERPGSRSSGKYVNRVLYLNQVQALMRARPNTAFEFGRASKSLLENVDAARKFAEDREGSGSTPSSRDLLLAIYSQDRVLAVSLKASGLAIDKLRRVVRGKPR